MTGFWKIDQTIMLGLFHFTAPANAYTHTLPIYSVITSNWSAFLAQVLPTLKSEKMGAMEALHGRHRSEICPRDSETSLSPSKHVWAYGWHFLD